MTIDNPIKWGCYPLTAKLTADSGRPRNHTGPARCQGE